MVLFDRPDFVGHGRPALLSPLLAFPMEHSWKVMSAAQWRKARWVLIGGIVGFLYHRWVGCDHGGCLISSNPWISSGYGALMVYLFYTAQH